jgi:hypothetical protein
MAQEKNEADVIFLTLLLGLLEVVRILAVSVNWVEVIGVNSLMRARLRYKAL